MLLAVILLLLSGPGDASDITRDFFGDIFRMRDCHNGSRCDNGGRRPALPVPGRHCYCQCAPSQVAYREDKQQCVKDIRECYMSVFYRPFTVEAIPLVYLPTSGQLVHPDAHLSLSMRRNVPGSLAKCRVTVSQYLTREGWRTVTRQDSRSAIFDLFTDGNKTFLQFLGSPQDRKLLQQHLALVRMLCVIPQYPAFETCVAIRVGWVPGLENIDDAPASQNKANMMVVGLSLGVLALVYIFAVLVYIKIRRQMVAKQKTPNDAEAKAENGTDSADKTSSLHRLEASSRLGLYHTASIGRQKHGNADCRENWAQMSPVVETYNSTWTDRMGLHGSEFRAKDFKLQPEFFDPEFMASPPHEVLEYLERLQNSVTFARHRMRTCYRYQPTLNGIPEDDYFYQDMDSLDLQKADGRTTPDGGSASSTASLQDNPKDQHNFKKRELPKIPPRKPKRKSKERVYGIIAGSAAQGSDQEQKEIQKAMNTLNDTLDALEYDMYKQEMFNHTSDSETANLSCQNSTSLDFDEFETSSCSSLSAATVLGRDAKRQSDISKCSQYVEKSQSEDIGTFSNSTYSLPDAMRGLFNSSNKASSLTDISNISRCSPSRNGAMRGLFTDRNRANSNSMSDVSNIGSRCQSRARSASRSPFLESSQKMNIRDVEAEKNPRTEIEEKVPNKNPDENGPASASNPTVEKDEDLLGGPPLRRSPSSESMKTVNTDMTTDSLDSRCSSPTNPSPTPSLMEMWISKLVSTSVPYSKNRRKSKKKLVLPEDSAECWEHVCQKHKDPCPRHDLNDAEPNLIDKLAHYGSKTMSGCDVAGYFQSLKQDVLKEHLKMWLGSNNHRELSHECSHKKPLVNGQTRNLVTDNGMHVCSKVSSRPSSRERMNDIGRKELDMNITDDSLEGPDSDKNANENIYYEKKRTNEKSVKT